MAGLREEDVDPDPIRQFAAWLGDVLAAGTLSEPYAMTLATADADGRPSARMVLLRGFDDHGFRFYTNYESQKGRELEANPRAALCFYWDGLGRQVRVSGSVERLSRSESEAYFGSRQVGSRLSAWASSQSTVVDSRAVLEAQYRDVAARLGDVDVPLPAYWGGYLVRPETIEFWLGRADRLHDRLRYRRAQSGGWIIERLSP
jgi:pyridoxamine 5'-phosphate oxidase